MSLAHPPPPPRLRDRVLLAVGRFPSIPGYRAPQGMLRCSSIGRVACSCRLFSGGGNRQKQDEARKALESAPGQNKTDFEKWHVQVERRRQSGRSGGPAAGGGGWSGGGGWFRWFTSGGFWDAAKQTVLTILGIIAAIFLIANFNSMIAAVVNSLLVVLRQVRRLLSFIAQCVLQSASVPWSGPKSSNIDSSNLTGVPVKDGVGMSAKERVVRKWGMD